MYAVEVRDHVMIAHSLPSPVFGPAQRLHGATYVVDAAFIAAELDANGIVVDIGLATEALAEALAPLRYRNLDDLEEFAGRISTTEVVCRHVFDALAAAARAGRLGDGGRLRRLRVTLHESHAARAWYEGELA
jgi:6-pyruvoyl-tetrahydropterin synthase